METTETQPTLREALETSIAEHVPPVEPVTPAAEPTTAAEPAATEPKGAGRTAGRARDETGKLLPGKAVRPATEPAAQPAQPLAPPSTTEADPAAVAAAPIPRPSSWKKDMWPIWDKMNTGAPLSAQEARQVAEYNAQRETQFATGVSTYKNIADTAKPLMDAVQPYQADIERTGMQPAEFVNKVLGDYKRLAHGSPNEKLALAHGLLKECGIPIQALFDQNAQQQFLATPHVPQPAPVAQPQNLETQFEQYLTQRDVKQTVEGMAKDTAKYPFFHYVRSDMSQLLGSGEATDLDDAYQKSLDLPQHAMLAPLMQQQQTAASTAAQEQQRVATAQKTAQVARANTVSPKSATPASQAAPAAKPSVRESLLAAVQQHAHGGGRV